MLQTVVDLWSSGPIVRGYFTWPRTRRIQVEDRYHVTYLMFRLRTRVNGASPMREQFAW
jgi:hypothetical protein